MATYNRYNQPNSMYEFGKGNVGRSFGNKLLRRLSNFGMDDQEMVVKNSQAVGAFQDTSNLLYEPGTNMYDLFTKKIISKILEKKSIAYLDRRYLDKRKILHQYAIKEEIKDYVVRIAEEAVMYDDDNYFCSLTDLPDSYDQSIRAKYQENFRRIYNAFNFNDGLTAWNYMKTFLIDGFLAFEIIFDEKQKNILDLQLLDPLTIVPTEIEKNVSMGWIQYPQDEKLKRVLLKDQVIYISYSDDEPISYVEELKTSYERVKTLENELMASRMNLPGDINKKLGGEIAFKQLKRADKNLKFMSKIPESILENEETESNDVRYNSFIKTMYKKFEVELFDKLNVLKNNLK